jgi:hypothetical protein
MLKLLLAYNAAHFGFLSLYICTGFNFEWYRFFIAMNVLQIVFGVYKHNHKNALSVALRQPFACIMILLHVMCSFASWEVMDIILSQYPTEHKWHRYENYGLYVIYAMEFLSAIIQWISYLIGKPLCALMNPKPITRCLASIVPFYSFHSKIVLLQAMQWIVYFVCACVLGLHNRTKVVCVIGLFVLLVEQIQHFTYKKGMLPHVYYQQKLILSSSQHDQPIRRVFGDDEDDE